VNWRCKFSQQDRTAIFAAVAERQKRRGDQGETLSADDKQAADVYGLAGEWAFARNVLGINWVEPGWLSGDFGIGDCRIDVKATSRPDGNLVVRPSTAAQDECDVYVLVRVDEAVTEATIVGWQFADQVRKAEFLTKFRTWVFFYPAEKLQPMQTLLEVG